MIEVEVKSKISSFEVIKNKLKNINAIKIRKEHQKDLYFNSPLKDFAKTDEALRIRNVSIENEKKSLITYKGPKLDSKSKTREEIELKIEDDIKLSKILEHLGFKKVREVIKNREIYELEEFIISLDDVEGLDPYMEIEIALEEKTDFKHSLDKIFDIFKKIGITDGFETKSYLELLEKKDNSKKN